MMIGPEAKIAIFVDSIDDSKRRYCYWDNYLREQGVSPTYISIAELAREADDCFKEEESEEGIDRVNRRQPRLDGFDTIILNWDVANGDFAFGADKTLSYFETRGREELLRWARQGARIIVEIQATAGFPLQLSYDAILGPRSVTVTPYGRGNSWDDTENSLKLNRTRSNHPIVREIKGHYDRLDTAYVPFDHVVFPRFDKSNQSSFARNPGELSWGNFVSWEKGWVPLFKRPKSKTRNLNFGERFQNSFFGRPVALSKAVGDQGGEIIVTTMRVANAAERDVIDAFVEVNANIRQRTKRFYRIENFKRNLRRIGAITTIWIFVALLAFPLVSYHGRQANDWLKGVISGIEEDHSGRVQLVFTKMVKKYGENVEIFDFAAFAMIIGLIKLSAGIWKDRDRS